MEVEAVQELEPHNLEAEAATLGAMAIDHACIPDVFGIIRPEDFFDSLNRIIAETFKALSEKSDRLDLVTICDHLRRRDLLETIGGEARISSLINETPSSIHALFYASIVKRTAILRGIIRSAAEVARIAYQDDDRPLDEILDQVEGTYFSVTAAKLEHAGVRKMSVSTDAWSKRLEKLHQQHNDGILPGLPTGIKKLDELWGGMLKGHVITLAARPRMGKTSLSIQIGLNVARDGGRVLIFSLELGGEELIGKIVSMLTGIDNQRIKKGAIRADEWPLISDALKLIENLEIYIDDTPGISISQAKRKARMLSAQVGLDLIIIDYLQLMTTGGKKENRHQEIGFISRGIKELARQLRIPILSLAQLNRDLEKRENKRPGLSDIRESGSIEEDSDLVVFIYRQAVYDTTLSGHMATLAELITAKHRGGPEGVAKVAFDGPRTTFNDFLNEENIQYHKLEEPRPPVRLADSDVLQEQYDFEF